MKRIHQIVITAGFFLFTLNATQAQTKTPLPDETKESREERIAWWREARFGMFIHWGLYAIPGGTWKDKVHREGYSEWIMFDEKIPVREYEKLAEQFNPVRFKASDWVGIAKKAGMKYMVLTTKHHDGFSMFHSSLTTYNVVDATPFKRDVTRELVDACNGAGMYFGCYYSIDRDWYRPQGLGNRYRQTNLWDYPDSNQEDYDRYFATFAKPQVEELLSKYQPDLLWFDEIEMKTDAQVEVLYQSIRSLRPECIINSRIWSPRFPEKIPPPYCDYITSGDNEILKKNIGFEWENPGSMNTSYGYNPNDHNWISAADIISRLVEIVSKGGNYLLNVGPTPEGLIPQPCIDRLETVGDWMAVNGEAIYGTSASVFGEPESPSSTNWRSTTKPGKIYLHLFRWPADGRFNLPGLQSKVVKAYLLAGGKEIKVEQSVKGVNLFLPAEAPDDIASVICLEMVDRVAKVARLTLK